MLKYQESIKETLYALFNFFPFIVILYIGKYWYWRNIKIIVDDHEGEYQFQIAMEIDIL